MAKPNNVVPLTNRFARNKARQKEQQRKRMWRTVLVWTIGSVVFLVLAGAVYQNWQKAEQLAQQTTVATEKQTAVLAQMDQLAHQLALVKDDQYLLQLARSKYYLSKEDELIFNLPYIQQDTTTNNQ